MGSDVLAPQLIEPRGQFSQLRLIGIEIDHLVERRGRGPDAPALDRFASGIDPPIDTPPPGSLFELHITGRHLRRPFSGLGR